MATRARENGIAAPRLAAREAILILSQFSFGSRGRGPGGGKKIRARDENLQGAVPDAYPPACNFLWCAAPRIVHAKPPPDAHFAHLHTFVLILRQ